jgi:hypothetical protein
MEKAYAKLHTCYQFLDGGMIHDALIDLTGGVDESFDLEKIRQQGTQTEIENLWRIVTHAYKMKSLMGASIFSDIKESELENGLVVGHAYTVNKLARVDSELRLVRLNNPWRNHVEWNGPFSDFSVEWNSISSRIKDDLRLVKDADGEFW